jgi:hypothetical protein
MYSLACCTELQITRHWIKPDFFGLLQFFVVFFTVLEAAVSCASVLHNLLVQTRILKMVNVMTSPLSCDALFSFTVLPVFVWCLIPKGQRYKIFVGRVSYI